MTPVGKSLSRAQTIVLAAAFMPMVGTGVAGGIGTYTNISAAYGKGTAVGAVAAGEGATAVLALVLLGLTMLGQSSPAVIRVGLWALPAAASVMSAMGATAPGQLVIYALTPMGMCASAEGGAFLARRIVVHRDGRDTEAERRAAATVRALAYHWARSLSHPSKRLRDRSQKTAWRLARKVGIGDAALGDRLLDAQRDRVTAGADAVLARMFPATDRPALPSGASAPAIEHESTQVGTERSTAGQLEKTPRPVVSSPDPIESEETIPADPEPIEAPADRVVVHALAAESARPRRTTGRVPESARSPRSTRTAEQLLIEAREATADWSVDALTAEGIRKELRTSPARARVLRDTLRAERAESTPKAG